MTIRLLFVLIPGMLTTWVWNLLEGLRLCRVCWPELCLPAEPPATLDCRWAALMEVTPLSMFCWWSMVEPWWRVEVPEGPWPLPLPVAYY